MAQEIADSKLLDTWGSSGTKIEPDISKIIEGWQLGEQPPHEYMNWLQNTFGSKLNHILKNGVAEWNNETEYLAGASVQHSGSVWLCETTNTNSEPTELNANWEKVAISKDLTVTVGTLADLRSISYPVNTVWASGYHTKNDGAFGSHIFRWNPESTEADNGGTVIKLDSIDTGRYELQFDGAVNVKWFGANEGSIDINQYLLRALALGKEVVLDGVFNSRSQIDVSSFDKVHISGGVLNLYPDEFINDWIRVNSTNTCSSFILDGIEFIGNSLTLSSPISQVFNVDYATIKNCVFNKSFPALKNSLNVTYENNIVRNWRANGSGIIASGNNVLITGNRLIVDEDMSSDDGIVVNSFSGGVSGSENIVITNNFVSKIGAVSDTSYGRNGIVIEGAGCKNITISNNVVENISTNNINTISAIRLSGGVSTSENISIANNTMSNCIHGFVVYKKVDNVSFTGNKLINCTNPFYTDDTTRFNWVIDGNTIYSSSFISSIGVNMLRIFGSFSSNTISNYNVGINISNSNISFSGNNIQDCTTAITATNHSIRSILNNRFSNVTNVIDFVSQGFNRYLTFMDNEFISCMNIYTGTAVTSTFKSFINNIGVNNERYMPSKVSKAGTVVLLNNDNIYNILVTGNITIYADNLVKKIGETREVIFTQGAIGYPVSFAGNIKMNNATVDTTANSITYMKFICTYINGADANLNTWVLM